MKSPQRVLALVTDAFGGPGGIAQYNRDFLTALSVVTGVERIDVLARLGMPLDELPAAVHQGTASSSRVIYAIRALWHGLHRRPDIIFCGHLNLSPLALLIAWIKRTKLVVQAHGVEIWCRPSWLQRMALDRADVVLAVSRHTRDRVLNWSTLPPERALVIPNTVGEEFAPGDMGDLRERLDLVGKKVLLCVGRLDARERYKGQDHVIQLIAGLVAGGEDVVFLVGGDGDDRPRLVELAGRCGVENRVRFLGRIDDAERLNLYRAADLYVMPSAGEGFGIAFIEAMACGTPAVGLAKGGAPDALGDGELGELVEVDQLLNVICKHLGKARSDGGALSARVGQRFGREAFRRRVAEVWEAFL